MPTDKKYFLAYAIDMEGKPSLVLCLLFNTEEEADNQIYEWDTLYHNSLYRYGIDIVTLPTQNTGS